MPLLCSDPALATVDDQEPHAGEHDAADSDRPERPLRADQVGDEEAEVLTEEPGDEREGQKHVAITVSCLMTSF